MAPHRDYSDLLLDHYRNPRNAGDLNPADLVVTVGNPEHGDVMRLSLRIEGGRVREARFKAFGCPAAIAAGSMTTELIRGRGMDEIGRITNRQVAEALGGLPESKIHCSVLAEQALREAVAKYGRMTGPASRERLRKTTPDEPAAEALPGRVRSR